MKKLAALALCLALLLPILNAMAQETDGYQYDATTLLEFNLRKEPDMSARKLKEVPKGKVVNVIEYGEEWCLAEYNGAEGYAKTKWLFKFHSHDPFTYTVPGYEKPYGMGTMKIAFNTKGMAGKTGNYSGNEMEPGDKVTVHYYNAEQDVATILVWRSYVELPAGAVEVEPFAEYQEAQPGDMICGYTTYTSMKYGFPYHVPRRGNMKRAMELLNGAVTKSGQTFSFNAYAAPYSGGNGYQLAYITGGAGKGYGGGSCQISILTYSAALGLPFRIGEHFTHTDEGNAYALQCCDATVGNSRDLTFTNLLPYDVRFEYVYRAGVATMMIYRDN